MQKRVLLIGKPCAGKSTWLRKLKNVKSEEFVILGVGELLREAMRNGNLIKEDIQLIESGKLIPDYVVVNLVLKAIRETDKNIIIDGFPRTLQQAKDILECGLEIDRIVNIHIDDEVALLRASGRMICEDCGKTYLPKELAYIAPCKDVIPEEDGICSCCGGKLVKRCDDEAEVAKVRLKTYAEETVPAIERLRKHGIPVVTLNGAKESNVDEFIQAISNPIN